MKKMVIYLFASIGFSFFAFTFIGILISSQYLGKNSIQKNTVLVLNLNKPFSDTPVEAPLQTLLKGKSISLLQTIRAIDRAADDPHVIGLVVKLGAIKMGFAQSSEIRQALLRFRVKNQNNDKFTIAFAYSFGEMENAIKSYRLATACQEIWLQPVGQFSVTHIGTTAPFAKTALENFGVKVHTFKRKEFKNLYDSVSEDQMSDAQREATQALLDDLMRQCVTDIALGRNLTKDDVRTAINQGPLTGSESVKYKLIDRLGYLDEIETNINRKVDGKCHITSFNDYLVPLNQDPNNIESDDKIAIIYADGAILQPGQSLGPFKKVMNIKRIAKAFRQALEDDRIQSIVLRVNSPGGSPVASEIILRMVRKAKQAGKPVIISMGDAAASGGYWISTYGDKIFANPGTITGSIGVVSALPNIDGVWKNIGAIWEDVKTGDNANLISINQPLSQRSRQFFEKMTDTIYRDFIKRVASGRGLTEEEVEKAARGRVWTGEDALKHKLVDQLGGLKEAIAFAKQNAGLEKAHLVVLPRPVGMLTQIRDLLDNEEEMGSGLIGTLFNLVMINLASNMSSFFKTNTQVYSPMGIE